MLLLTAAWYLHADLLFHRTGLGEAIWHPSGGYSPDIMEAAGPTLTISHWSTFAQLTDAEFYKTILNRIWQLHLTPIGTLVAAAGALVFWNAPYRRMVDVWFATVVAFILVTAEGLKRTHELLEGLGYLAPFAGSKNLRDTRTQVRIEFLVSGQFPGDGKPKPVAFPDPEAPDVCLSVGSDAESTGSATAGRSPPFCFGYRFRGCAGPSRRPFG